MKKIFSEHYTTNERTFEIAAFADQHKVSYKIYEGIVLIPQFELSMTAETAQDFTIHSPVGISEIISVAKQFLDENT